MTEQVTRFAYIMSRLGIRAEEVSKRTGIDKTLISRWKNGQRRLSPASAYSKRISSFLLSLDNAESIISKTLNAYGLDERNGPLQDNFIFWLAEQGLPSPSLRNIAPDDDSTEYTASFRAFLGKEGLRSSIITMLDYMMTLPGTHNISAMVLSNFEWLTEDHDYCELLADRLQTAFEHGHRLTLICRDNLGENLSRFSGIGLSAHLRGYIKSYYLRENNVESGENVLLAVKDGVCLFLQHDESVSDGLFTTMYTDNVIVRHAYNNFLEHFAQTTTQFRYGFFSDPEGFLTDIDADSLLFANNYTYSRLPSFGSIPLRQVHLYVRETLRDTKLRTEQLKELFTTPAQMMPASKTRHIFCLDDIEALLLPGRKVDYPLSAIYGKRVYHSRKMVLEQLQNIRNWLKSYDNYEIALVPKQIYDEIPLEASYYQNNFCVAWTVDASESTCVKDKNKVASLFAYAEQQWENLPKYCKDRQRCIRQLNQWLMDKDDN